MTKQHHGTAFALMITGLFLLGVPTYFFAGPLFGLSTTSASTCTSIYGLPPQVIESAGSPSTPQQYFNYESSSSSFAGVGPWEGPQTTPAGQLNPGATSGESWGATPKGDPVAVWKTGIGQGNLGAWTNPSGGLIAVISWENTIYYLPAGTYTYAAPGDASSGGLQGSTVTVTVGAGFYDLSLYVSGECSPTSVTSVTSAVNVVATATQTSGTVARFYYYYGCSSYLASSCVTTSTKAAPYACTPGLQGCPGTLTTSISGTDYVCTNGGCQPTTFASSPSPTTTLESGTYTGAPPRPSSTPQVDPTIVWAVGAFGAMVFVSGVIKYRRD